MMKLGFNNKGDIPSMIFAVVAIFIVGILFLFSSRVTDELYTSLDDYFNETAKYNDSVARTTVLDIRDADRQVYDYAFLIITMGLFMVLALTAFSTRISPLFYWIYGVLSLIILALGVILSNAWQSIAENPEMADTIVRFPITNAILGSYFPTLVSGILVIVMIFLFGKPPGSQNEI